MILITADVSIKSSESSSADPGSTHSLKLYIKPAALKI